MFALCNETLDRESSAKCNAVLGFQPRSRLVSSNVDCLLDASSTQNKEGGISYLHRSPADRRATTLSRGTLSYHAVKLMPKHSKMYFSAELLWYVPIPDIKLSSHG